MASSVTLSAQTTLSWEQMAEVQVFEKFSNSWGVQYYDVQFGESLQALDGIEVMVLGYLIPMDALGETYALSKNPYSSCFFCGNAGPETVIELRIAPEYIQRYPTDTYRAFRGRLQLNRTSLEQFNFVLLDAIPL